MARGSVSLYTPKDPAAEKAEPKPAKAPVDLSRLSVDDLIRRGTRLIEEDRLPDAVLALEWAHKLRPTDARSASYYGLSLALSGHDPKRGGELCRDAIRREFYRADLYLNLGKVYLVLRDRRKAISTFKKGLSVDRNNEDIQLELLALGKRQEPVFGFLSRSHFFNKLSGKIRARFAPPWSGPLQGN